MPGTRYPNGSATQPRVSSAFGPRAGGGGASTYHRGADMPEIYQIRAVADGVVAKVGTPAGWSGGGKMVWIQHDGYFSKSAHMASFAVSVGQRVSTGDLIGAQDTTGTAKGSNLHFEITPGTVHLSNSGQVDPIAFLRSRITVGSPAGSADIYNQWGGRPWIIAIQEKLIRLGYNLGPWGADGDPGSMTQGAIKDFQGKNGLEVDGVAGPLTNAKLDERLANGVGYNAIPNERATADVQRLVGAKIDGIWGDETTAKVKAWQAARPPLVVDGIWGPASDAVGFPKAVAYIPIPATGGWDEALVRALQSSLGFTGADIDGDRGPITIKAQQVATGMPVADQDGEDGPLTTRYLQASLGVRQDGQAGPLTFEALRARLNGGGKLLPGDLDVVEAPTPHPKPAAPEFPLATRWDWSVNSSPRTGRIQLVVGHHMGIEPPVSADGIWNTFMNPNGRSVSANLQINNDGTGYEPVPPTANRAWTTGQLDHQASTFEMMNATGAKGTPPWGFSEAALEMAAQFLAWNHKQFGVPLQRGKVVGTVDNPIVEIPGFVGHNETPAGRATSTVCPGSLPYESIIARAKQIVTPEPEPEPEPDTRVVTVEFLADAEFDALSIASRIRREIERGVAR